MSHRHSSPFSAVKILLGLGIFGMGGCGGGGGGGTTPEPPEPPAQPRLSVSPGTLNETLELGAGEGTATITLSNSGSSGNAFSITDNADWITVDPTSGTVAANGTSTLTATYSCEAEENRAGTITVTGSNGSLDRSTVTLNVDCQRPEIQIEVVTDPVDATVPYTRSASTSLVWKFTSTWDGQGALDYEVTSSNAGVTVGDSTGSAEPNTDTSHNLEFACSEESTNESTVTISVDGQSAGRSWTATCRKPNITIRIVEHLDPVTIYMGEQADSTFQWEIQSEEGVSVAFDYEIKLVDVEGNEYETVSTGTVEHGDVVETTVNTHCDGDAHRSQEMVRISVEDETLDEPRGINCVYAEPHHIDLRWFQGVEALHIEAVSNREEEGGGTTFSWDMTHNHLTDFFEDRQTFLAVDVAYTESSQRPSYDSHREVEVYVVTDDGDVLLDDVVGEYETDASRPGEYHGSSMIFDVPEEYLEDFSFRFVLDPDDDVIEESEDNNELTVNNSNDWFTPYDVETMKINLKVFPIDHGGDMPADDLLEIEGAIYGRLNDVLPLEEISLTIGDTVDMTEVEWSVSAAYDRIERLWMEEGDDQTFYVGLFARSYSERSGVCGKGDIGGRASVVNVHPLSGGCESEDFLAHEIGHNLGLRHAPGCDAPGSDPEYPHEDGGVGNETAWLMSDRVYYKPWHPTFDLMTYCIDRITSHYHYEKMVDSLVDIYYPEEEETAIPLSLVAALNPAEFEQGKTLLVSGRINWFGQWSTTFMKTVHKSMESVSKAGSGYTISLVDDHSGAVIYSEPLRIHEVDHAPHKVWSARLPVPKISTTLSIVRMDGVTSHSIQFNDGER